MEVLKKDPESSSMGQRVCGTQDMHDTRECTRKETGSTSAPRDRSKVEKTHCFNRNHQVLHYHHQVYIFRL